MNSLEQILQNHNLFIIHLVHSKVFGASGGTLLSIYLEETSTAPNHYIDRLHSSLLVHEGELKYESSTSGKNPYHTTLFPPMLVFEFEFRSILDQPLSFFSN